MLQDLEMKRVRLKTADMWLMSDNAKIWLTSKSGIQSWLLTCPAKLFCSKLWTEMQTQAYVLKVAIKVQT